MLCLTVIFKLMLSLEFMMSNYDIYKHYVSEDIKMWFFPFISTYSCHHARLSCHTSSVKTIEKVTPEFPRSLCCGFVSRPVAYKPIIIPRT